MGVFLIEKLAVNKQRGLPHARGGVSPKILQMWKDIKSSPRTWGCFQIRPGQPGPSAVFPTHVGVFPESSGEKAQHAGLPHARGGVSGFYIGPLFSGGSSPRTWGCFFSAVDALEAIQVFPTHVGVFLIIQALPGAVYRLPHARGGVSLPRIGSYPATTSSPRMWGGVLAFRLFVSLKWRLPHARGGVSGVRSHTHPRQMSSPTHVGVFLRRLIAVMISGSLPHARGGVSGIHDAPYQRGHSFCLHHVRGVFLVRGLPALAYWSLPYTCGT